MQEVTKNNRMWLKVINQLTMVGTGGGAGCEGGGSESVDVLQRGMHCTLNPTVST